MRLLLSFCLCISFFFPYLLIAGPYIEQAIVTDAQSGQLRLVFSENVIRTNGSNLLSASDFDYTDLSMLSSTNATFISTVGPDADGSDGDVTVSLDAPIVEDDLNDRVSFSVSADLVSAADMSTAVISTEATLEDPYFLLTLNFQLSIGHQHALILNNGKIYILGSNTLWSDQPSEFKDSPELISDKSDWVTISAAYGHNLAIDSHEEVYAWGKNDFSKISNLNHITSSPSLLTSLDSGKRIEASQSSSFIQSGNGTITSVGRNHKGQLGINTVSSYESVFYELELIGEVTDFSIGIDHGLAIVGGNLYAWGSNGFGQLGMNTGISFSEIPILVDETNVWVDVEAGGFHSLAITDTQDVFSWGKNTKGQLGHGSQVSDIVLYTPTMINSFSSNVQTVSAGIEHTLFLTADHRVFVGGANDHGQSITDSRDQLNEITDFYQADNIEAGDFSSAATWGSNFMIYGTLSNSTFTGDYFSMSTLGQETYLLIDLSAGNTATSYPVTYSDTLPDLTASGNEVYKTTTLVLRKIESGTFTMGSPDDELGRVDNREVQHEVTLNDDYYIGVFELTQKQWELVMGTTPSSSLGDSRPVESITWEDIRGQGDAGEDYDYPNSGNAVDMNSFMGLLRSKTGLGFDLPTEAQWEYACRAGTTSALNNGANLISTSTDPDLNNLGRYAGNGGGSLRHAIVGSFIPNNWGLYDMHGNVREICLDWFVEDNTAFLIDPIGPTSGTHRVGRGGGWGGGAFYSRSAYRFNWDTPSSPAVHMGFRVGLTLED